MVTGDRRAALALAKLRAIAAQHFADGASIDDAESSAVGTGAGLLIGRRAVVYLPDPQRSPSPLAALVAWGAKRDADEYHLVLDQVEDIWVASAAGLDPTPTIWRVTGTSIEAVREAHLPEPPEPPPVAIAAGAQLAEAGLDVIVEHGVVVGEFAGLEVARIAVDAQGEAIVRVGVGLFDQEAHAVINADLPTPEHLAKVIEQVREQRTLTAGLHPLNRFSRERWLRSVVVAHPELVGCRTLVPLAPLEVRGGIHEPAPAAALGVSDAGTALVVCSAGIDLDLVPTAAGHVAHERPDEVVLVLPERDHHAVIETSMKMLAAPARLVAIAEPWPV
ncbi:MAG: hypothetical protein ACE367_01140 [Acidimicrobiales bacterium]